MTNLKITSNIHTNKEVKKSKSEELQESKKRLNEALGGFKQIASGFVKLIYDNPELLTFCGVLIGSELFNWLKPEQQFYAISLETKWPPIIDLSKSEKRELVKIYKKEGSEVFEKKLILKCKLYFTEEHMISLKEKWKTNGLLDSREFILNEIITCHNNKNYFASVILALSQIEGIIADGFYHKGRMQGAKYKEYLELLFNYETEDSDETFKSFILHEVLKNFEHGKYKNYDLSRHAIMHGADKTYGIYEKSIQSIMLLDYLQDNFNYIFLKGSKIYHRHGCSYLEKTSNERVMTKNIENLTAKNMRPCKKCSIE